MSDINLNSKKVETLRQKLEVLRGTSIRILSIPKEALQAFEPSQIGTLVGALMDACIPHLSKVLDDPEKFENLGLSRSPGILKDREGYPDYLHRSGIRLELKLIYVEPNDGLLKVAQTRREPSARVTQKVTVKNVVPDTDLLWVVAYQLVPDQSGEFYSPQILDFELFSMIECVRARDFRLEEAGGIWFGDYETPTVLSQRGREKISNGLNVNRRTYGRKESEGKDFNEDTNFGKLKRIPYKPLQEYLKKSGADYSRTGSYPRPWSIS